MPFRIKLWRTLKWLIDIWGLVQLWNITEKVLGWGEHIKFVIELAHHVGGIAIVVQYLLDPPPVISLLVVSSAAVLIWFDLRRQSNGTELLKKETRRVFPVILIVVGALLVITGVGWLLHDQHQGDRSNTTTSHQPSRPEPTTNPVTQAAPPIAQSAAPQVKPHYSLAERDAILDFLRKFEAFFRERETPNATVYSLVQRFGATGTGRNVPRPSQSAELADRLEKYGQMLEEDSRSFQKMLDDAKFFSAEITPTVSNGRRETMNFRGVVLRVAFALREAAKIKEENINMLVLLAKPLEELDSGYATYYTWISDALQKIESKVREVRTWN